MYACIFIHKNVYTYLYYIGTISIHNMFIGIHGVLKERRNNNVMFVRALWFPFGPEAYCNNNTTIDYVCTTTTMAV